MRQLSCVLLLISILTPCASPLAQPRYDDPRWWKYDLDSLFNDARSGSIACSLAVSDTEVYVGGCFWSLEGAELNSLAVWNPVKKTLRPIIDNMGMNGIEGCVAGLVAWNDGIVAFGKFKVASKPHVRNIALWKDGEWSSLGAMSVDGQGISAAVAGAVSKLYVGGSFTVNSDIYYLASWDGSKWEQLGQGIDARQSHPYQFVYSLIRTAEGLWVVGAYNKLDGRRTSGLALWKWDHWQILDQHATLSEMSGYAEFHDALLDSDGSLILAGIFDSIPGHRTQGIARYKAGKWYPLGGGLRTSREIGADTVSSVQFDRDGKLYAYGTFDRTGDSALRWPKRTYFNTAMWDGSVWRPVDTLPKLMPEMRIVQDPQAWVYSSGRVGELAWVHGTMTRAGSVPVERLAFTDGKTWMRPFGVVPDSVTEFTSINNKDLIAIRRSRDRAFVSAYRYDSEAWDTVCSVVEVPVASVPFVIDSILFVLGSQIVNDTASLLTKWNGDAFVACDRGWKDWYGAKVLGRSSDDFYLSGRLIDGSDTASLMHYDGDRFTPILKTPSGDALTGYGELVAMSQSGDLYFQRGLDLFKKSSVGWTMSQSTIDPSIGSVHDTRLFYSSGYSPIYMSDGDSVHRIGSGNNEGKYSDRYVALNDSTLITFTNGLLGKNLVATWEYLPGTLKVRNSNYRELLTVWPNPSSNVVRLSKAAFPNFPTICDEIGRLMQVSSVEDEEAGWVVDVSAWRPGAYFALGPAGLTSFYVSR